MRIKSLESAKLILNDGMYYYWKDAEESVNDIFRACEKFHGIRKLGYTPMLRNLILEGCRHNRLQIWGTQDKNNANSYARNSPELMYLVLDLICTYKNEVLDYLQEIYGDPYVVTFTVDEEDKGFCSINEVYGRYVEPERILSVEKVDITKPDPHFAMLKNEKIIPKYEMVACRN